MNPWLLDAFCCEGGATRGYQEAGYRVLGVDINPQPKYIGDDFVQGDAIEFIRRHGHKFAMRHGSPPCQKQSVTWRINKRDHPSLIGPTRAAMLEADGPYIIENVMAAAPEMIDPVMLCGGMFDLGTYRHRLFESNRPLTVPDHAPHVKRQTKMGRPPVPGEMMHIVGNFTGVAEGRVAMGIDWMNRDGLREAIPPAYTNYTGRQMLAANAQIEGAA